MVEANLSEEGLIARERELRTKLKKAESEAFALEQAHGVLLERQEELKHAVSAKHFAETLGAVAFYCRELQHDAEVLQGELSAVVLLRR